MPWEPNSKPKFLHGFIAVASLKEENIALISGEEKHPVKPLDWVLISSENWRRSKTRENYPGENVFVPFLNVVLPIYYFFLNIVLYMNEHDTLYLLYFEHRTRKKDDCTRIWHVTKSIKITTQEYWLNVALKNCEKSDQVFVVTVKNSLICIIKNPQMALISKDDAT